MNECSISGLSSSSRDNPGQVGDMSIQKSASKKKNFHTGTLNQRVSTLYDELRLAAGWQRPSILVATYRSRLVLIEAQVALEKKLQKSHQGVYHLRVNEENYDIPVFLAQFPERENTVFFITGLLTSGGNVGMNAYRTLNIRREVLVDYSIRSVFWLNEQEAETLPIQAPDFWSFRHRMIDFLDGPVSARFTTLVNKLADFEWESSESDQSADSKITLCRELLDLIPVRWKNEPILRAELNNVLGWLYLVKGDHVCAINHLKPALEIAEKLGDKTLQSRCWVGLGMVLQSMKRLSEAETAFQTSQKLDPKNAQAWMKLGKINQDRGNLDDALVTYKKSIDLNPKIAASWRHLGNLYQQTGKMDAAAMALQQLTNIDPTDIPAWKRLGDLYKSQGRMIEALPVFKTIADLQVDDSQAWIDLGVNYLLIGNYGRAIRAFYKAARRAQHDPFPWKNLGDIYLSQKKLRYARKSYKTAINLDPQNERLKALLKACYPARESTGKRMQAGKNNNGSK